MFRRASFGTIFEWRLEGEYPHPPGIAEVWTSDAWYAERVGAKYVPLGSHPGLATKIDTTIQYDVALMAYVYGRREGIKNDLIPHNIKIAPNAWGEVRNKLLQESAMMLHVHQFAAAPTIAPQRFALAAAYKLPLLSEAVVNSGIVSDSIAYAPYDSLVNKTKEMLDWPDNIRRGLGEALYNKLCCEYSFSKCIEAAI